MKLTTILMIFISICVFGQNEKYWYAFDAIDTIQNPLSSSLGFKDINGNIKVKPIYISPLTQNKRFEKVVALTEYKKGNSKDYYLNKAGKRFGIDSVYSFDFTHDTEQEGFIRFKIGKYLDSIGLFNSNGKVMIEPIYNSLSKVNNGLVIAKIGAIQKHEPPNSACDHWFFEGGKQMILDTLGNILIDNFKDDDLELNLYSLKVSEQKNTEKFRHNFKGLNKKYYSFISSKEEFQDFIKNDFLKNISKKNNNDYLFLTLKNKALKSKKIHNEILEIIEIIKNNNIKFSNYAIVSFEEEDNKFIQKYLDNADELIYEKYPTFEIESNQNKIEVSLSFIRTENGYKIYDYRIQKLNANDFKILTPPEIN